MPRPAGAFVRFNSAFTASYEKRDAGPAEPADLFKVARADAVAMLHPHPLRAPGLGRRHALHHAEEPIRLGIADCVQCDLGWTFQPEFENFTQLGSGEVGAPSPSGPPCVVLSLKRPLFNG